MHGGISIGLLINTANKNGAYHQLELIETPPEYEIKEEYLVSVYAGYTCKVTTSGGSHSMDSRVDHPAFTALRNHLGSQGFIAIESSWSNGDIVLKEFILNGKTFYVEDSFPCAPAMKNHLEIKEGSDYD